MEVLFVRLYVDVRKFGVRVRNLMPVRVLQRITGFLCRHFRISALSEKRI